MHTPRLQDNLSNENEDYKSLSHREVMDLQMEAYIKEHVEFYKQYYTEDCIYYNPIFDKDQDKEITTQTIRVHDSARIRRLTTDIYHDNSVLFKLSPRNFEELIAALLEKEGFQVQLTKQTRDGGYDILGISYIIENIPLKLLVECKKFKAQKVDVNIVRSFKEVVISEQANKGMIVTTSYFSKEAIEKREQTPYLLDFKDKDDVIKWITKYK